MEKYSIGIDIGSTSAKTVVVDENKKIIFTDLQPTGWSSIETAEGIRKLLAEKGIKALQNKFGSPDYNALNDDMKKTFVKVITEDLSPLLPRVKASTLLVFGENDTETPLWMGKKMEAEIPDAGLVIFENDDHFAYLHQWQRFTAVVRAFLK